MEATKNDELFDDELCGMVKFTDATVKSAQPAREREKPVSKECVKEKKTNRKRNGTTTDADWEPVKTWYDEKTVNCAKWFLIFGGLEYLVFYWQQTGQMQESAAMPSMIVCALLAGISVGKNWKWRN